MDPVTSLALGEATSRLVSVVKEKVIGRWTKARSAKFFEAFLQEVELEQLGGRSDSLEGLLEHIIEDESCSEVIFDAYRSVCLTKSKSIGPKIIGLLTAKLVLEEREADEFEEDLLEAAERLSDDEFMDAVQFYKRWQPQSVKLAVEQGIEDKKARLYRERREAIDRGEKPPEGYTRFGMPGSWPPIEVNDALPAWDDFRIKWQEESFDSNWNREYNTQVGSIDLSELGRWAIKLKSIGILQERIVEHKWEYEEDSERHIDQDGSVRQLVWWLSIDTPYLELIKLDERATAEVSDSEKRSTD